MSAPSKSTRAAESGSAGGGAEPSFRERLIAARAAAGLSLNTAPEALKREGFIISRKSLAEYERKDGREPAHEKGELLLAALGRIAASHEAAEAALSREPQSAGEPADELVGVPALSVTAACGDGVENDLEEVVEIVHLPRSFILREYGVPPESLRYIIASGTSNVPTILPGQRVLVSLHVGHYLRDGRFYALASDNGLSLKRLFLEPGHVRVTSDNTDVPDFRLSNEEFDQAYRVVAAAVEVGTRL